MRRFFAYILLRFLEWIAPRDERTVKLRKVWDEIQVGKLSEETKVFLR